MAVRVTPAEYAEKHAARLKASIPDIRRGVERVTESPTEKAAQRSDKYLAGVQQAVADGRWQAGLRAVSLAEWKSKTLDKGLIRIATGIDAAKGKVTAFAAELLPFEDALLATVDAMPDMTLEDSIARSSAWIRGMSAFRRR